jgi:hypothetical protein
MNNIEKNVNILMEIFTGQHFSPVEMHWSEEQQKKLATAFLIQFKNANEFEDIALTPRDENNSFLREYKVTVNDVKRYAKTISVNDVEKVMGNSFNKKENASGYFDLDKVSYITGLYTYENVVIILDGCFFHSQCIYQWF